MGRQFEPVWAHSEVTEVTLWGSAKLTPRVTHKGEANTLRAMSSSLAWKNIAKKFPSILSFALMLGLLPSSLSSAIASGTPTFSGFTSPLTANEQTPTQVFPGLTFVDSGVDYAGGWIEYSVDTATSGDSLWLETATVASVLSDSITVVGSSIFKGNGTSAVPIGTIDGTKNGRNGNNLRVNLSNSFTNSDFSDSSSVISGTSINLSGWTIYNKRVKLGGVENVAGWPTPTDPTFPTSKDSTANHDSSVTNSQNYNWSNTQPSRTGTGYSVLLSNNPGQCQDGFCIIRGPYIVSDSSIYLQPTESVSFYWKAQGGNDDYDVFGYLLNVDNGNTITLLDSTGTSTSWAQASASIPSGQAGNYKFIFIAGTYDASGGRAEGGTLYIDDVSVSAISTSSITDQDIANLTLLLRYQENSDAPQTSRTIRISTHTNATGGVQTISIVPVDDLITLRDPGNITRLKNMSDSSTATGTLLAYDPDFGTEVSIGASYGISGGSFEASSGIVSLEGQYGLLKVESSTGSYTYDFYVETITAAPDIDKFETFTVTASDGVTTASKYLEIRLLRTLPTDGSVFRTIYFTSPNPLRFTKSKDEFFTVSAVPSAGASDGTVTYSIGSSTGCTLSGTTVTITANSGTCTVTANISQGTNYRSATTTANVVVTLQEKQNASGQVQVPQPNYVVVPVFGGVQGTPYSLQLQTVHTTSYELQGSLPPGLSLNTSTGLISGTPSTPGTYRFVIILRGPQVGIGTTFDFDVQAAPRPEVVPNPDAQSIPEVQFGNPWVTLNGASIPATVRPNATGNGMEVNAQGWYLTISGMQADGKAAPLLGLPGQQSLVLLEGQRVYVGGSGFKANSKARVFLFKPEQFIGELKTDAKGEFSGIFALPESLVDGNFMIQVTGISPKNELRSASLPFLFERLKPAIAVPAEIPQPEASPTPAVAPSSDKNKENMTLVVPFAFNVYKISSSQVQLIKKIASRQSTKVRVVGYAQPSKIQPDIAISLNRAIEVKKSISKILPQASFTVRGSGSKPNPLCAPYKNKCVVIYVKP